MTRGGEGVVGRTHPNCKHSADMVARCVEAVRQGATTGDAGKPFGLRGATVWRWCRQAGVSAPIQRKRYAPSVRAECIALVREGASYADAGRFCGVPKHTVRCWSLTAGITKRKRVVRQYTVVTMRRALRIFSELERAKRDLAVLGVPLKTVRHWAANQPKEKAA